MNFKTIFFDVYQTLTSIDYGGNEEAWDVFAKLLNNRGITISTAQFREDISREKQKYYFSVNDPGMKLRHHNLAGLVGNIFLNYNINMEKGEMLDLIWKFRQLHHPEAKLYPGIKDVLAELSQKYTLAVASYTQGSYTCKELERLGIAQYFSHFVFSSDIGYRKTDQEFYKICLQETSSEAGRCLMIGDNYLQDVVIPKKVGIRAILVRNPLTDKQNVIDDVRPDGIVKLEDIATLPSIVRSIAEV